MFVDGEQPLNIPWKPEQLAVGDFVEFHFVHQYAILFVNGQVRRMLFVRVCAVRAESAAPGTEEEKVNRLNDPTRAWRCRG